MAKPLIEMPGNLLFSTNKALSDAGATEEHAAWMRKPKFAKLLVDFIDGQRAESIATDQSNFPIWKTITIGGKSRDEILAAFEAKGFKASKWAMNMIMKFEFVITRKPRELDLALATIRELGFPRGTETYAPWERIKELGSLCPSDLGPHLRLAYGDQPKDECIWIAMGQIVDSDGYPSVFEVRHDDDGRWLDGTSANPIVRWDPDDQFVFVRPRK